MDWLTREQIDRVIDSLSAADIIEAMGDSATAGPQMAANAFNSAAERLALSNGTPAMQHVRISDFKYLADRISGAINVDGPLASEPSV